MGYPSRDKPRYVPDTAKAVEVILWLASREPGIDIYHLVKAAYFADKEHITRYGRPIVGDEYRADVYGPLPRVIYGLLRHDPLEILAAGSNGRLPFEIRDIYRVHATREPNLRRLSASDIAALDHGHAMVRERSFGELVDITHDDPAWINADGGTMDYRDFIPLDDPDRDAKAADIAESARHAVM